MKTAKFSSNVASNPLVCCLTAVGGGNVGLVIERVMPSVLILTGTLVLKKVSVLLFYY